MYVLTSALTHVWEHDGSSSSRVHANASGRSSSRSHRVPACAPLPVIGSHIAVPRRDRGPPPRRRHKCSVATKDAEKAQEPHGGLPGCWSGWNPATGQQHAKKPRHLFLQSPPRPAARVAGDIQSTTVQVSRGRMNLARAPVTSASTLFCFFLEPARHRVYGVVGRRSSTSCS